MRCTSGPGSRLKARRSRASVVADDRSNSVLIGGEQDRSACA